MNKELRREYNSIQNLCKSIKEVYRDDVYVESYSMSILNKERNMSMDVAVHKNSGEINIVLYNVTQFENHELYIKSFKSYDISDDKALILDVYNEIKQLGFNEQVIIDMMVLQYSLNKRLELTKITNTMASKCYEIDDLISVDLAKNTNEIISKAKDYTTEVCMLSIKTKNIKRRIDEIKQLNK